MGTAGLGVSQNLPVRALDPPGPNDTRPFDSDTLSHRNPSSCAPRAPVNAANTKNT